MRYLDVCVFHLTDAAASNHHYHHHHFLKMSFKTTTTTTTFGNKNKRAYGGEKKTPQSKALLQMSPNRSLPPPGEASISFILRDLRWQYRDCDGRNFAKLAQREPWSIVVVEARTIHNRQVSAVRRHSIRHDRKNRWWIIISERRLINWERGKGGFTCKWRTRGRKEKKISKSTEEEE